MELENVSNFVTTFTKMMKMALVIVCNTLSVTFKITVVFASKLFMIYAMPTAISKVFNSFRKWHLVVDRKEEKSQRGEN